MDREHVIDVYAFDYSNFAVNVPKVQQPPPHRPGQPQRQPQPHDPNQPHEPAQPNEPEEPERKEPQEEPTHHKMTAQAQEIYDFLWGDGPIITR